MNWSESYKLENCTLGDSYEAIAGEIHEEEEESK